MKAGKAVRKHSTNIESRGRAARNDAWRVRDSIRAAKFVVLALAALGCGNKPTGGSGGSGGTAGTAGNSGSGGSAGATRCYDMDMPPRAYGWSKPAPASLEPYYPTTGYRTADPAAAGFDPAKLEEALSFATAHSSTRGILVLRRGYIVAERYSGGYTADTRSESFSMAKSFTSALVGIAIDAGLLSGVDERVCKYYSEWDCNDANDARSRITVKHAMNIETGLQWHEDWRSNGTGSNDAILGSAGLLDYTLAKPAVNEPGTLQRYSTGDPSLLSGVLQGVTGKTAYQYAKEVLFDPIGIPGVVWNSDSKGRTTTYAGLQATLREYAKFGFLYSRHGEWEGRQIVPGSWVDSTTKPVDPCHDPYRYLWHTNPPVRLGTTDGTCADFPMCTPLSLTDLPADSFFAEGILGQFVFVVPSAELVIARSAQDAFGADYWDEYSRGMLPKLLDALQ